jgi:rare lipoprotein A (peptidoglycan hydrolase)
MKAKTKRRLKHLVGKKHIIHKKHAKHLGRSVFLGLVGACTASLAYAVSTTHPTVDVNVHSTFAGQTISAPVVTVSDTPAPPAPGAPNQVGRGSWYALGLSDPDAITCASRTFPRGSELEVTDEYNGNKVTCLVNDYGPAVWTGRVIDLSRGSFEQVDSLGRGTIPVEIRLVGGGSAYRLPSGDYDAIIGYSLCREAYSDSYCENHRQD